MRSRFSRKNRESHTGMSQEFPNQAVPQNEEYFSGDLQQDVQTIQKLY